ncbi:UbiX family flavin prenyltransferase [Polymorphobacter sp.]|uniref:UbiX family flavin prenyltransferase n=1 Tax=Polymorphobacter sp. TaxID=1909290 RepID=UPI003F6E8F3C
MQSEPDITRARRLVIGITGASGAAYGVRLLEVLADLGIETHLIVSKAGVLSIEQELGLSLDQVRAKAAIAYQAGDIGARIASGSFRTDGMIIAPCTVRTMSEIACGTTDTLMTRAADVVLKERRRLVLMVRETPLHLGHLRTMVRLAEIGAILMPPMPAFYTHPQTLGHLIDHSVSRVLDLYDIETDLAPRWDGLNSPPAPAIRQA